MVVTIAGKLREFQKSLESADLNAFFVTNTMNVYYFTRFLSMSYAYLIVYPEGTPYLFVPELEYEDAMNKVKSCEVIKIDRNREVLKVIKQNLENHQVGKVGIEDNSMSVKFYLDISEKHDFPQLEKGSELIDKLRSTKTPEEIEKIKKACQIADKGMVAAMDNIAAGMIETDVALEAEYVMRKEGSEGAPFDTIVASGYRSALPHGISSNKKIKEGELIIIDLGAKYEGYCSDMTRTVTLGAPNTKQAKIFNVVLKTQRTVIKACEIDKRAAEIDEEARKIFSGENLNEYFVHSLGHGVGLDVHELPYIGLKSKDILTENNTFTIEPGIYISDFGGVRIEDVVLITKRGVKYLTKSKYELH